MKKLISMILSLTLTFCFSPPILLVGATSQEKPEPAIVLGEYEKWMDSYVCEADVVIYQDTTTISQPFISYPADYAGAYYGNDGYLHINITSSPDNIDFYTDIVDASITRFHIVDYPYTYLMGIHDILKPYMEEYGIYEISTIQADNKTYVYTDASDHVFNTNSENMV